MNADSYIDQHELQQWIEKKVAEHFMQAQKDNERIFAMLDTDQDGGSQVLMRTVTCK